MVQREETVIFQKIKKRTEAVGLGLEAARGSRQGALEQARRVVESLGHRRIQHPGQQQEPTAAHPPGSCSVPLLSGPLYGWRSQQPAPSLPEYSPILQGCTRMGKWDQGSACS